MMFACCADSPLGPSLQVPGSLLGDLHALALPLLGPRQRQRQDEEENTDMDDGEEDYAEAAAPAAEPPSAEQLGRLGAGKLLLG